jgi:hypothetical protein
MTHHRAILRLLALAVLLCAGATPAGAQERGDGLDQPLRQANWCGAARPGDAHFTLAATGDTFPHENIQAVGEAQGYESLFDHIRPFLRASDLAYTNFDGAMLAGSPYSGYPAFNYNPALGPALRGAGIGLVSTANNHILDRGPEGLDATLQVLAAVGIQQHGTAPSGQQRPPYLPLVLRRGADTLRIGFVSASWGTNGIPDPGGQVNLLWQSDEYGQQGGLRQSVLDAVAQARRESDIVVVAAHWGYEYQFYPDAAQVDGARQLAAAGADLILGAQSHTLQPVDVIDVDGRRALVIYSLANFLASQGAFQDPYYSATSVVFYVGLVRHADGSAGVTGYRYLPTLMIDGDTRPAPLPLDDGDALAHVRLMMRDPGGALQVPPDPAALPARVEVCPVLALPGVEQPISGDFAQLYRMLGGQAPQPIERAIEALGLPLSPPSRGMSGDCAEQVDILLTERARLELHAGAAWPYRVVGTPLGVAAFRMRYPGTAFAARTDLGPEAFADPAFAQFFFDHGGVPIFGYPISAGLREGRGAGTGEATVQYFERALFERSDGGVALAPLGRTLGGEAPWCAGPAPASAGALPGPTVVRPGTPAATLMAVQPPVPSEQLLEVAPQAARDANGPAAPPASRPPARLAYMAGILASAALTAGASWRAWRAIRAQQRRARWLKRRSERI